MWFGQLILCRGGESHEKVYRPALVLNDSDNKLKVVLTTVGGDQLFLSNGTLPNRVWTHVVVTVQATTLQIFFDGKLDGPKPIPSALKALAVLPLLRKVRIGQVRSTVNSSYPNGLDGSLGGLRWWNRPLTVVEIDSLREAGPPKPNVHEQHAAQVVGLIASIQHGTPHLCTKRWMRTLLHLLETSNTSMRIRVLRLMRRLFASLTPAAAQDLLWDKPAVSSGSEDGDGRRLISYFLELVACSLWKQPQAPADSTTPEPTTIAALTASPSPASAPVATTSESSEQAVAVAAEVVMLLRYLITSTKEKVCAVHRRR